MKLAMSGKEPRFKGKLRKAGQGKAAQARQTKLPSIKNQIRGVQRLLAKAGTDPKVRQKQEQKLKELLLAKQQHEISEKERKFAKKYHKVRFFERVKIERQLNKLEKHFSHSPEEQARLQQLKIDLEYVLHFPKGEKYVSLLKNSSSPEEQARLEQERARLRALVRKQLAEAALLAEADEGQALSSRETGTIARAHGAGRGVAEQGAGSGEEGVDVAEEEDDDFFLHSDSGSEGDDDWQQAQLEAEHAQQQRQRRRLGIASTGSSSEEDEDGEGQMGEGASGSEEQEYASMELMQERAGAGNATGTGLAGMGGSSNKDGGRAFTTRQPNAAVPAGRHKPALVGGHAAVGSRASGAQHSTHLPRQFQQRRQQAHQRGAVLEQARVQGTSHSSNVHKQMLPERVKQPGLRGSSSGQGMGQPPQGGEQDVRRGPGLDQAGKSLGGGQAQQRSLANTTPPLQVAGMPAEKHHGATQQEKRQRGGSSAGRGAGTAAKKSKAVEDKTPLRTRADGGRKRRKRNA